MKFKSCCEITLRDILIRVIEEKTLKIISYFGSDNQGIVGQKTTDTRVPRSDCTVSTDDQELIDRETGNGSGYLSLRFIDGEVVGAIYLVAKIENVFSQMQEINRIFIYRNSHCFSHYGNIGDFACPEQLQGQLQI